MICNLENMKSKEVIDMKTGERLGYIDDVKINLETSNVIAFIIYGRDKLFGLLGKDDDIVIPCQDIEVIGEDVLLIKHSENSEVSIVTNINKFRKKSLFR